MCACARPSAQPSRTLATKGGLPQGQAQRRRAKWLCARSRCIELFWMCRMCVRCSPSGKTCRNSLDNLPTEDSLQQFSGVCNSGRLWKPVQKSPNNDGAVSDEDMRCHDPQTCTTSRHQTCYTCPSIRGGTHIRLPIEIQRTKVVETRKDVRVQPRTGAFTKSTL